MDNMKLKVINILWLLQIADKEIFSNLHRVTRRMTVMGNDLHYQNVHVPLPTAIRFVLLVLVGFILHQHSISHTAPIIHLKE